MPASQRVTHWVNKRYKKPRVDPEWLDQCYEWAIDSDPPLDPDTDFDALIKKIDYQILQSNFNDSMLPGTGLPIHIAHTDTKTVLTGPEIHVEVIALTEIGHSAFSLNQTRLAREERIKEGNIVDDPEQEGDIDVAGEGPMPKYSRGMLHFQLTDGTTTVPAIEYRALPQLSLQDTPLGIKVVLFTIFNNCEAVLITTQMKLKNVRVHKGIVWLEPETVVLLGEETQERNENREAYFARGLRARMRLPEPAEAERNNAVARPNPAPHPPVVRSPLREISPPPSPPAMYHGNDDEDLENRRRRIPVRNPGPLAPSRSTTAPSSTNRAIATTSSHFAIMPRSQTLVNSQTPILSLSPTIRQARPTLSPPPDIQPEDEHFWSDDEKNENLRTSSSPGEKRFVDDFGALALKFIASLSVHKAMHGLSQSTISHARYATRGRGNDPSDSSRRKGKERQTEMSVSSDEYDDDIVYDEDVCADLDAIEAMGNASCTRPASTVGSKSSGVGMTNGIGAEVITIEDSDDDDKENNPVATRHVRQRMASDVIELSDSD
ncbi:hypothetical protein C0995_000042 [Termitomyces sp. Mi166|nr:hypothetical protein C0995_000042 [Termitomyces sp. Mi166\